MPKSLAYVLYLEDLGLRSIGRMLKVSNVAVLKWIKALAELWEEKAVQQKAPRHGKVIEIDEMWHYATDHWKVYKKLIPENKLVQSKAETQGIECTNNRVRHYLKRFNRKTLCYTKSKHMLLLARVKRLISVKLSAVNSLNLLGFYSSIMVAQMVNTFSSIKQGLSNVVAKEPEVVLCALRS